MLAPRATRLVGIAAPSMLPLALAYRFALVYRVRAGYPAGTVTVMGQSMGASGALVAAASEPAIDAVRQPPAFPLTDEVRTMNTWDAVHGKRAIREFADRPIEPDLLDRIVRAGTRAHSSKNQQRWAFVVVQDRARLEALSRSGRYAGHIAGAAAAVALVTPDPRAGGQPLSVMWDLGGAAAQMMLVAWDAGIGSCPATVYEQPLVHEILGLPDGLWCEYILSFGYPADPSLVGAPLRAGGRRPMEDVVHRETWAG